MIADEKKLWMSMIENEISWKQTILGWKEMIGHDSGQIRQQPILIKYKRYNQ